MDRDLPRNTPDDLIRKAKRDIQVECKAGDIHRMAIVTKGREIENDIEPIEQLRLAIVNAIKDDSITHLNLTEKESFVEEIADIKNLEKNERERFVRRLTKAKTKMAQEFVKANADSTEFPAYISELYEFIKNANVLQAK